MTYNKHFATRTKATTSTPQSAPIPGRTDMVQNSAGGYTFQPSDWTRLERFLILGAAGGTFYLTEKKLTVENAEVVQRCLKQDGKAVVQKIVEVSKAGRGISNDPALFALAIASADADEGVRQAALAALPEVARTGTHLMHFVEYAQSFRGWGRALKTAVQGWFMERDEQSLAYQLLKYKNRDGWSQRDMLRLAKPKPDTASRSALFHFATKGTLPEYTSDVFGWDEKAIQAIAMIDVASGLSAQTPTKDIIKAITDYNLTHEMIPTEAKSSPEVWDALLQHMPITALIRNLGNMSKVGLLVPLSDAAKLVAERITDVNRLKKGRVHPLSILVAQKTYAQGHGFRGTGVWTTVPQVITALDKAFYLAFDTVKPTGKKIVYGCDVSGSMGTQISGKNITCAEAVGALALVLASTEEEYYIHGFTTSFVDLKIRKGMTLAEAQRKCYLSNFGGTDCSVPMLHAKQQKWDADAFVVLTDSETWAGRTQPTQALAQFRQERNKPDACLAVVGMVSNGFTIADPKDPRQLDVVGFDTALPTVLNEFIGYKDGTSNVTSEDE